jgi:hypothetical protein
MGAMENENNSLQRVQSCTGGNLPLQIPDAKLTGCDVVPSRAKRNLGDGDLVGVRPVIYTLRLP